MITITEDLRRALNSRLKLGERQKPVCEVQVDRLVFVPGETQLVDSLISDRETIEELYFGDGGDVTLTSVPIVFPAVGYNLDHVTAHFGELTQGGKVKHQGIDIGCSVGTPIVAAWDGKVIYRSDNHKSYGKYVIIEHNSSLSTLYAHLSHIDVNVGDFVTQGQQIGLSGNTGNVWAGGKKVTSEVARANGAGAHLHFEIREYGNKVDPLPYLTHSKKLYTGVEGEKKKYVIGSTLIDLNFSDLDWLDNVQFKEINNMKSVTTVSFDTTRIPGLTGGVNIVGFNERLKSTGFKIERNFITPASLSLSFTSDFDENGMLLIYYGDQLVLRFNDFSPFGQIQEIRNMAIPAGTNSISFVLYSGGGVKKFAFDRLIIKESIPVNIYDSQSMTIDILEQVGLVKREQVELTTGRFVYSHTKILEDVISVDIENNEEMEAATATIVVANKGGKYSPDYNPNLFSEFDDVSEWSHWINGMQIGILSENTPIRIYLGYGVEKERVFTGLIDKVDIDSLNQTLTITCRDMYKRCQEKVISEKLSYPAELVMPFDTDHDLGIGYTNANREQQIVMAAQKWAQAYGVDYKLILAIAKHETDMGTKGAGTEEAGSYICGYGVYDNGTKDSRYAGIPNQCKYVAKRIYQAIGNVPITEEAIEKLRTGGNLGPKYIYATDPNWTKGVWQAYQSLPSYPQMYNPIVPGVDYSVDSTGEQALWVKSAIIQDLIHHAGLVGWRAAADDLQYPDYIIEETYLIEANQATGTVVVAGAREGEFIEVPASSAPTVYGWMNPFVEMPLTIEPFTKKVNEVINEILKDVNYRAYCDRYGTFRLERIKYNTPIVKTITEYDDLVVLSKSIDFSRARSHLCIKDELGNQSHFIDKEILLELKGEIRSATVQVPWAKTEKEKEEVAKRMFWDMKRLCRTLQVAIPGDPSLNVLDRVYIYDSGSTTRGIYQIKGIQTSFSVDNHYTTVLDLFWCRDDALIR